MEIAHYGIVGKRAFHWLTWFRAPRIIHVFIEGASLDPTASINPWLHE